MDNQTLEIKAGIQIQKPPHEVFEAIVDPAKMSNYFISESTGEWKKAKNWSGGFPNLI
jgi:uncharacterized protein YndB with AHSA1/START domain